MVAQNTVKIYGKWFYAGEEIKEVKQSTSDFSWNMNPTEKLKEYNKTEINRMSTAELKTFAKEHEIDGAEGMTGAELKKVLIEKLGL